MSIYGEVITISQMAVELQKKTIEFPSIPERSGSESPSSSNDVNRSLWTHHYACQVFNKISKAWELASISYREEEEDGIHRMLIHSLPAGRIGMMTFGIFDKMADLKFGCPALCFQDLERLKYGDENSLVPKIEIMQLDIANKNYDYVGYQLILAVFRRFQKINFRADVYVGRQSFSFYSKLGFRPNSSSHTLFQADNSNPQSLKMHLPSWAITQWSQRVLPKT